VTDRCEVWRVLLNASEEMSISGIKTSYCVINMAEKGWKFPGMQFWKSRWIDICLGGRREALRLYDVSGSNEFEEEGPLYHSPVLGFNDLTV